MSPEEVTHSLCGGSRPTHFPAHAGVMNSNLAVVDRWDRAGEIAAYGAALALTPYLVIKVSWVAGALAGVLPTGDGMRTSEWVALNLATIVMSGVGIVVALALVRPWGLRLPARLLVAGSWIGAGFLVPLLPYAVVGLVDIDAGSMPVWEAALIQAGFVGMGLGLAVALPAYFRRRWPDAMTGRIGDRRLDGPLVGWSVAAAAGLAAIWTYAALDSGMMLGLLFAAWALAAAVAVWCLVAGRPSSAPRWIAMTVAWLGSGSLFAWSAWKLPLSSLVDTGAPVWTFVVGILVGAVMLRTLVGGGQR